MTMLVLPPFCTLLRLTAFHLSSWLKYSNALGFYVRFTWQLSAISFGLSIMTNTSHNFFLEMTPRFHPSAVFSFCHLDGLHITALGTLSGTFPPRRQGLRSNCKSMDGWLQGWMNQWKEGKEGKEGRNQCTYVQMYHVLMSASIHLCMYACRSARIPEVMYSCIPVWICPCMNVWMYECMYVWMFVCMYLCIDVSYVCMHACMHACMYACMVLSLHPATWGCFGEVRSHPVWMARLWSNLHSNYYRLWQRRIYATNPGIHTWRIFGLKRCKKRQRNNRSTRHIYGTYRRPQDSWHPPQKF